MSSLPINLSGECESGVRVAQVLLQFSGLFTHPSSFTQR